MSVCFQNFKTLSSIEVTLSFEDTGLNIHASKNKILVSEQRRENSRGTTLIPRPLAEHLSDDNHHPVLITKNNFGLLTHLPQAEGFSSRLRDDFQPDSLTCSHPT